MLTFGPCRIGPVWSLLAVLVLPSTLSADDWPQWRGPTRDGVWRETGIVDKFAGPQIPIKWRVPVASGYCGPTVAAGRVYVMDRLVEPEQRERVHCFDEATGKTLWSFEYPCKYVGVQYTAGPRASVTVHEGRAYALGTMGDFHCFDAATGQVLWKKNLLVEYLIDMPIWGIAAAPLVENDLVVLQIGGRDACLVAFDRISGKERWTALDDRTSYSAPIVIEQAGQRVVVCWTGDHVAGLNPTSGEVLWKVPFRPTRMVIGIATPVVDGGRLFVTSFYDGSLMLELDSQAPAARVLWQRRGPNEQNTDALHSIIATPLLRGDYVYGVDSYGELRCLDAKTGDRLWEDQTATPRNRWSNIHMVTNGDRVWMFNEAGQLVISRLSPQGFEELSRAKLLDPTEEQLRRRGGVCWAHPAYANRHVFARNDKELVSASLAANP
jgi:outer membrane protein assembly factor BamB